MNQLRKRMKKGIAVLLAIVFVMNLLQITGAIEGRHETWAEVLAQLTPGMTNVNVRQQPNTSSTVLTQIQGGQPLTILDQPNDSWYHVTFVKVGTETTYTGYVHVDYVTVLDAGGGGMTDTDFEAYLTAQGFPESYKPYLRELHTKHPNWKFVAVQTGLDWNDVIEHERSKQGQIKNLVQGTSSYPRYNWRSTEVGYEWATDKWYSYDGTQWFAASDQLVSYYMDPRTYMYETFIFAFEQLSYDSSVHNQAGVEAILANSFMWNSCPAGETRTFSSEIMEAAATYNVSPYHVASRMRQEMGTTAGVNATGTSSNYPGIFNFFNVGSVDSAGGGAVNKGLAWASLSGSYGRPWNSAYKAIMGGTQFLGASYISKGQDTLYTQKFNVTNTSNLYGHQYMSNVQAPANEARSIYNAYVANGLINSSLVFKIPVYYNMPDQAVTKPADSGSPNNWLSSLSVSGYALTPSFAGGTTNYSLIVENNVNNISVSATTVNSRASIAGTGGKDLVVGTNTIPVTVTAQNGTVRTYTLTVIRKDSSGSAPGTPTLNTNYRVDGTSVSGIQIGTTAADLTTGLGATGSTVTVYKADGATVNTGAVGTGNIVKITNGTTTVTYTVVIYGDISGDGAVGIVDLVNAKKYLLSQQSLEGAYFTAADTDKSGSITIKDLVTMKKHILGQGSIAQ